MNIFMTIQGKGIVLYMNMKLCIEIVGFWYKLNGEISLWFGSFSNDKFLICSK